MLFPTPVERVVELVAPTHFKAPLAGDRAFPSDPTSNQQAEQLPTYNAYSIDGDVTGPLVYVNYGMPADYEELERRGISVKGAIVIARYGGSWRGIKPKVAAEHGAVGCLIYSDPRDDGYAGGDVFPERADASRARACSAAASRTCRSIPGDPLTPGVGATKDAKRLAIAEAQDASRRSRCCRSRTATRSRCSRRSAVRSRRRAWRGGLPITYRLGAGPGARASQREIRLEPEDALRCDRDDCPAPPKPTSGSFAATTTTRG